MSELQQQFGQLLKAERNQRKLSLADISTELKITENNLSAIEEGDYSALPSDLYYRLFAKSYSEYLGIDFVRTMEAIMQDIGEFPVDEIKDATTTDEKFQPRKQTEDKPATKVDNEDKSFARLAIILSSVTILLFGIFLVAYKIFWSDSDNSNFPEQANHSGNTSELSTEQMSSTDNDFKGYNWTYDAYERPDSLILTFAPSEPSWAAVFSDGDTAIYQTLNPGRIYRRAAQYRFIVSIGVPRVVEIKLNGRPIQLAPKPGARITKVEINQTNYHKLINPVQAETGFSSGLDGS